MRFTKLKSYSELQVAVFHQNTFFSFFLKSRGTHLTQFMFEALRGRYANKLRTVLVSALPCCLPGLQNEIW